MNQITKVSRKTIRRLLTVCAFVVAGLTATTAIAAETVTYYHLDALGSPIAATDAQGNVVWRQHYAPYGERLDQQAAAAGNSRWYTGHPHDEETGLTYMGARYYDPIVGRFMGIDPKEFDERSLMSFNRYVYANDNPYKYVDPDGKFPIIPIIIGVLAELGNLAYEAHDSSANPCGDCVRSSGVGIPAGPVARGTGVAMREAAKSGLGDLTKAEVKQIQKVVDEAGRPLEIVGSAARGTRKSTSDIDYIVPPSSREYFKGAEKGLPGVDPKHGLIPGTHNPNIGPGVRFEPGATPKYLPGVE